ncbi:nuclear factor interleukin-3-regulated protein-like protein [Lates japonicus]|uniref:Nuclear factor interleukin-3-regulated protein-like protein n=1 Tax=Lates japonicus TaxID=270547 RepID=A0AAD3MXG9_LATJO|nr:nuclear factor interleukin-3-regulated protein-like protein [Lates japonicus]
MESLSTHPIHQQQCHGGRQFFSHSGSLPLPVPEGGTRTSRQAKGSKPIVTSPSQAVESVVSATPAHKYSCPRFDMSDGSSRDSPEPMATT